ncbi:alkaline phosphatase family protein [Lacipirellula limnantheis]|uniref:Type I phosphodiesterase / nucleotide pyrophosphatase n=1 Tax=Lacipirellula limnantheis TaxID=2528024 RepID=A0A517TR61_9BACT|nr:alkaline phosphatase family protein [Lacipirellula limnantheis]QDT70863.1 Type I phosphodiesterase / nucleotide pyrophosphatase [Lacipirellula limnantheis]
MGIALQGCVGACLSRIAVGVAVFAITWPAFAAAPAKKVLVIGIDGCRFDAVKQADAPHLDALMKAGAVAQPTRIFPAHYREADTISGPGWSNILCGVWADKHRVMDNEFTAPNYEEFPHFFARLKEAKPEAVTASFSDWGPIAKRILSAADVTFDANETDKDYVSGDVAVTAAASKYLREADPAATVVYLGQVDETGHKEGFHPSVAPYVKAIEQVDGHIGELLKAIELRPTRADEDWLILVTTDHGGSGTGHGGGHDNPEVACSWLVVSGDAAQPGKIAGEHGQVDLVPTALKHLGVVVDPAWKLDGAAVGLK